MSMSTPNIQFAYDDIAALQKNYTEIFSNVEAEKINETLSQCYIRTVVENGVAHLKLEKHRPWSLVDWFKRAWNHKEYTIATESATYKRLQNLIESLNTLSSEKTIEKSTSPVTKPEDVDKLVKALATILEKTAKKSKESTKEQRESITTLFTTRVETSQKQATPLPTVKEPLPTQVSQKPPQTTSKPPTSQAQSPITYQELFEQIRNSPAFIKQADIGKFKDLKNNEYLLTFAGNDNKGWHVELQIWNAKDNAFKHITLTPGATIRAEGYVPSCSSVEELEKVLEEEKGLRSITKQRGITQSPSQKKLQATSKAQISQVQSSDIDETRIEYPELFEQIRNSPAFIKQADIGKFKNLRDNEYLLTIAGNDDKGWHAELQVWRAKDKEFKHIPLLAGANIFADTIGSDRPKEVPIDTSTPSSDGKVTIKPLYSAIGHVPSCSSVEELEKVLEEEKGLRSITKQRARQPSSQKPTSQPSTTPNSKAPPRNGGPRK